MSHPTKPTAPLQDRVSRRDFFSRCSSTASSALAAPLALASEFSEKPENQPIHVAILGLGHRGAALAEACHQTPGWHLSSVFDPHQPSAERVRTRLGRHGEPGPKFAGSELELIENKEIDAVLIATPADLHHRQIQAALAAGKHVLTEKPAGLTKAELEKLLPAIERLEQQVFMVAQERRYHSQRAAMVQWLKTRPLGELVDFQVSWTHPQGPPRGRDNWLLNPARSGDWVAEHGDHIWEMLLELTGEIPEVTSAGKRGPDQESSRFFSVQLRWPGTGATAHVRHSMLPGGNFTSPGLSFLVQYEKGMVDMIHGRVSAPEAVKRLAPEFSTEHDEIQLMLAAFATRIRTARLRDVLQAANQQECRLAARVHEFRSRIQSCWA